MRVLLVQTPGGDSGPKQSGTPDEDVIEGEFSDA